MKRSLKASGLLSALSLSLFGVSVVGCSAEVKPDGETLGTASQAYSGSFNPQVGGVNSSKDLQFSAEFKLAEDKILVIGGYNAAGDGQTSAGIITNTGAGAGTWTALSNALPTGLGELEIVPLNTSTPPTRFLLAGGRAKRQGTGTTSDGVTNTYILNLSGSTATWTDLSSTHPMVTGVVLGKNNLQKCGASHWIAIGGMTTGGMDSSTPGATDTIQKFNYDPTTPGNSNWETLKLGSSLGGTVKTVKLPQAQGYHQVLHVSDTTFDVAGGDDGTNRAISNVERLVVNSNAGNALDCTATDASVNNPSTTPTVKATTSLPSARARAASIKASGTITVSGVDFDYDFIIATGNDNQNQKQFESTTLPTQIFFYNSSGTPAYYNNAPAKNLSVARVFGRLVKDDTTATSVKMGTGTIGNDSNAILFNTTTSVNVISNVGGITTGTAMSNSRVGSAVQLLTTGGNADFAALGTKYSSSTTGVAQVDVEDF
jgi:hypothetical protein